MKALSDIREVYRVQHEWLTRTQDALGSHPSSVLATHAAIVTTPWCVVAQRTNTYTALALRARAGTCICAQRK